MKNIYTIQMNLLRELDHACKENGIRYILTRHTLRSALLDHSLPKCVSVPTIAMRYDDAVRLSKLINRADRGWDNSVTNRNIPRMVMRYTDINCYCIRVDEIGQYKNNGISVDIELIRNVPAKGIINRGFVALEAMLTMCATLRSSSRVWKCLMCIPSLLEKAIMKIIYSGKFAAGSKRYRISRFPKKSIEFSDKYLTDCMNITVENHEFLVPHDIEQYMQIEFDGDWKKANVKDEAEDFHLTVMGDKSDAAELDNEVKKLYGKGSGIRWARWYMIRGRMRRLREKVEGYWNILFSTKERFTLWKQYMPKKKIICEQYSNGQIEEVKASLMPYMQTVDKYFKDGLVICFDPDIFDILLDIYCRDGKKDYAERLRTKVYPGHLNPITIEGFDYD